MKIGNIFSRVGEGNAFADLQQISIFKDEAPRGDTLVVVFLRGAADILNMIVPHGQSAYYAQRPTLGNPRPDQTSVPRSARVLDLDGFTRRWPRCCPPGRKSTWPSSMPAARRTSRARTSARWRMWFI